MCVFHDDTEETVKVRSPVRAPLRTEEDLSLNLGEGLLEEIHVALSSLVPFELHFVIGLNEDLG